MTAALILKEKGAEVVSVGAETRLSEAVAILHRRRIGAIVILDEKGEVAGILSERDVVAAIAEKGQSVLQEKLRAFMTSGVTTCRKSDSVDRLMAIMTETRIRHLPIVEDGILCGIVSIGDVVKHRIAKTEQEVGALRDYISSG